VSYVLLGVLGFLAGYLFELASVRGHTRAKPLLAILAGGLLVYATVGVSLHPERFWLPPWLQGVGWGLLLPTSLLLACSLFVELPFRRTYLAPGPGPHLVTRGSYALVRHPSVLGYGLWLLGLLLVARTTPLLVALPLWLSLDVLWAVLQERLVLCRTFPGYPDYQRTTPMLLPNRRSLGIWLRDLQDTLKRRPQGGFRNG